jgi:hypothetical protein
LIWFERASVLQGARLTKPGTLPKTWLEKPV